MLNFVYGFLPNSTVDAKTLLTPTATDNEQ